MQDPELQHNWLSLNGQMALLMALRSLLCLHLYCASPDGQNKTVAIYVQVGQAALEQAQSALADLYGAHVLLRSIESASRNACHLAHAACEVAVTLRRCPEDKATTAQVALQRTSQQKQAQQRQWFGRPSRRS
jgi:hypothetical protein